MKQQSLQENSLFQGAYAVNCQRRRLCKLKDQIVEIWTYLANLVGNKDSGVFINHVWARLHKQSCGLGGESNGAEVLLLEDFGGSRARYRTAHIGDRHLWEMTWTLT